MRDMQLPKLKLGQRGQAEAVSVQLGLIITLIVAIIIVYQLGIAGIAPTSDQLICDDADTLVNASFSDNTGNKVDNWDNTVEGTGIVNAWNSGGYVTVTRTDNGLAVDNLENSNWYQSMTISSIGDGVCSAAVSYSYRVIDNDNAISIVIKVLLDDGSDNTILLNENVTTGKSASWTSGENNVLDNVDAAGTYTLYLRTEIVPDNSKAASNIQVGWTSANLTVSTETKTNPYYDADARASYDRTVVMAWAGIGLMALAIIVLAASVILTIVRGTGGARV